jgi:biofilm PGA synthesis protein PgaD
MSNLIIETPQLQNLRQRYGFAMLTLIFWVIWLYMWLPLISLVAWVFGMELFYYHMIELGGYVGFLQLLGWYAVIILLIATVFGAWMLVNIFRFRGKEKRGHIEHVNDEQVAAYFGVDAEYLSGFTNTRSIIVHQTTDGRITCIESKDFV